MKWAAAIVVSLLLGFILGGWGPKTDLRKAESQVKVLEEDAKRRGTAADPSLTGITRMLNIPEARRRKPAAEPEQEGEASSAEETAEGDTNAVVEASGSTQDVIVAEYEGPPQDERARRRQERWRQHEAEQRMEEAAELWRMRSDIARGNYLANIGASDEESGHFDVLVEAMNLRIETTIADWADQLRAEEINPAEAGVRMMNEITGAIALTYDELDRTMPTAWRDDAGERFRMFDFIDPRVATPLIGMEGRFEFEE